MFDYKADSVRDDDQAYAGDGHHEASVGVGKDDDSKADQACAGGGQSL